MKQTNTPPHPPPPTRLSVYIGIKLSVCLSASVPVSHLCPEDIFWTPKLYAVKLGMMVHHHNRECHAEKLGSCLQGQGHCGVKSSIINCFLPISPECVNLLQPNLVFKVHHHTLECCVTTLDCCFQSSSSRSQWVRVHIFMECLSGWYLLNHLIWLCVIMTRSVMRKGWVPIFKVRVTMQGQIQNYPFLPYLLNVLVDISGGSNCVWW